MKNFEKYDLDTLGINGCKCMHYRMFGKSCNDEECAGCPLETAGEFVKWANEEYVEPINITHDEYVILKNLPSWWKWIARDEDKVLNLFESKPSKSIYAYKAWILGSNSEDFRSFRHLFKFIQWSDEEPYEIAKLIADYEKENGNE